MKTESVFVWFWTLSLSGKQNYLCSNQNKENKETKQNDGIIHSSITHY